MGHRWRAAMYACVLSASSVSWAAPPTVSVSVLPAQPLIEKGKHQQLLSCDFQIHNQSAEQIELSSLEVSVLGKGDKLLAQYRVGANGMSVTVVPNRVIGGGKKALVFNPLFAFPEGLELENLRFDFRFDVGDEEGKYTAQLLLHPRAFTPRVSLTLPVTGPVLVHDGHDFYGHHRRLPLLDEMAQALKWNRNFMRYSYDFVVTDEQGRMYKGDGARNEDWFGWGAPVFAPGGGKVTRMVSTVPDNTKGKQPPFTRDQFVGDPSLMWGNTVEIDHGHGEFSMLAHLKEGSVTVKVGDVVRAGQQIGQMGFSGDAFLVHLHYDLKSGPGFDADGLPSPFNNFERLTGASWLGVKQGHVDSGDVVRRARK